MGWRNYVLASEGLSVRVATVATASAKAGKTVVLDLGANVDQTVPCWCGLP